jgi:hypothetical protein
MQQAVSTSCSTHAAAGKDGTEGAATYCFEVQAASGSEHEEHLIDYNGHDQHATQQQQQLFGPDGQLQQQQLGGSIQQYVYDEVSGSVLQRPVSCRFGRKLRSDKTTQQMPVRSQCMQTPTGAVAVRSSPAHVSARGMSTKALCLCRTPASCAGRERAPRPPGWAATTWRTATLGSSSSWRSSLQEGCGRGSGARACVSQWPL